MNKLTDDQIQSHMPCQPSKLLFGAYSSLPGLQGWGLSHIKSLKKKTVKSAFGAHVNQDPTSADFINSKYGLMFWGFRLLFYRKVWQNYIAGLNFGRNGFRTPIFINLARTLQCFQAHFNINFTSVPFKVYFLSLTVYLP